MKTDLAVQELLYALEAMPGLPPTAREHLQAARDAIIPPPKQQPKPEPPGPKPEPKPEPKKPYPGEFEPK
jgi:hypothetical protein